ncbi:hypothetical protein B0T25DRAFT_289971 [Lasiosphaeria hispida]|uniref:Uncharacterized protein n=1 Tax=Lasiosphaeria hispida TaxID=260671 RepID=A0AAJ0MBH0_9PEZI|nr:hypothetical protein B0T25DRAFT_289971 [Lasiosphaeria hispida]
MAKTLCNMVSILKDICMYVLIFISRCGSFHASGKTSSSFTTGRRSSDAGCVYFLRFMGKISRLGSRRISATAGEFRLYVPLRGWTLRVHFGWILAVLFGLVVVGLNVLFAARAWEWDAELRTEAGGGAGVGGQGEAGAVLLGVFIGLHSLKGLGMAWYYLNMWCE